MAQEKDRDSRILAVLATWAQCHAKRSESPNRFMAIYTDDLNLLRRKGEEALLDQRRSWKDPVQLAAEMEALAAFRALACWSTVAASMTQGKAA